MAATSLTFDEGHVIVVHCSALLSYRFCTAARLLFHCCCSSPSFTISVLKTRTHQTENNAFPVFTQRVENTHVSD